MQLATTTTTTTTTTTNREFLHQYVTTGGTKL